MVLNFPVPRICLSTTMTFVSTLTTCSWKDYCKPFPTNRLNPGQNPGCLLASEQTTQADRNTTRQMDSSMLWHPAFPRRIQGTKTGSTLPEAGPSWWLSFWIRMTTLPETAQRKDGIIAMRKSMLPSFPGWQSATQD